MNPFVALEYSWYEHCLVNRKWYYQTNGLVQADGARWTVCKTFPSLTTSTYTIFMLPSPHTVLPAINDENLLLDRKIYILRKTLIFRHANMQKLNFITLRVRQTTYCVQLERLILIGGFVISRIGFPDETLLELEEWILLGGNVAKDIENVANAVGTLKSI